MNAHKDIVEQTQAVSQMELAKPSDFPRIALYMEQVTSFFEEIMHGFRRKAAEKLLTKTMVNNYTKEGILHRPQNKKYDRAHMIKLVYITLLKQMLSMQDIKRMLQMLEEEESLEPVYECLLEEIDGSRANYQSHVERSIQRARTRLEDKGILSEQNLLLLTMMTLGVEATADKMIIERLIDENTEQPLKNRKEE